MSTLSADYINELVFDYIETYSFRRGAEYEQLEKTAPFDILYNKNIVDENGQFFPHSIKTNTFKHDHPVTEQIKQLLQIEIEDHLRFLCEHIYRDAIVFYDRNHQIVSTLNICLSCFDMRTDNRALKADYKTFGYFKKLFLELGHDVENPEYNIIDEVEELKKKFKKRK